MNLLIVQLTSTSRHSVLRPHVLLSTLFSIVNFLFSSLNVRHEVSYPYRTTGKIIVFYIQIFTFVDSKREDKFWAQW
jgi:hypothetical protein